MGIQAGAFVITNPSFIEPEFLLQYSQPSGYSELLADGKLRVRLAPDDLWVYMKQMNMRFKMLAGQASPNELPGTDISTGMIRAPTYLQRVRARWDHHDVAAGSRWGFAVPEAYRLAGRQGHFSLLRDAGLYGYNPANGEGIINAPGAVALNMPPDSNGNTTASTYDNGQAAFFLAQQVQLIKSATYNLGIPREFTMIAPQRILGPWEYNVVQLVQYQRVGAGTQSTAGTTKEILMANGDKLIWTYDDTLEGKGSGGTDLIIVAMPTVAKPAGTEPNTNEFAKMSPGSNVCITQYADMPAPREIISPLAGGATDFLQEMRATSGWVPRPQALRLVSISP